jgi:nitroreductase
VIARLGPDDKIPESERFSSASCVCFALLQAAQAAGFGAQWLTGWPAYDADILQLLGLDRSERIAGFIHIGTPRIEAPERERPDARALLSDWNPA